MELYVIAQIDGGGPVAAGVAKSAQDQLDALQKNGTPPLKLLRSSKLPRGWDSIARTILERELARHAEHERAGVRWYRVPPYRAKTAADKAFRATQVSERESRTDFGPVVTRIRTTIFGCSMEVFAAIAGTVTSTVSRWEKGELQPGLDEIRRLRAFAVRHGLAWNDRLLFEEG